MELAGVSLRYHRSGPWVLRGVSAKVGPGEAVLVTGRNGAGKSTLLQVVAGLLPTSRGSVLNRPQVVGWVPERFPVRQPFTARTYLNAVARIRGMNPTDARTAIESWSERLQLTPYLAARLAELSKGSAQKVGIVQALLVRPNLLVLDEPWEGLDAQARAELPSIIDEITDAGGFCVFSDHHGDAGHMPGVRQWDLDDGLLTEPEAVAVRRHVIELVVPAKDSASTVARLRGDGFEVRAVWWEKPHGPRPAPDRAAPAGGGARPGGGGRPGGGVRPEGAAQPNGGAGRDGVIRSNGAAQPGGGGRSGATSQPNGGAGRDGAVRPDGAPARDGAARSGAGPGPGGAAPPDGAEAPPGKVAVTDGKTDPTTEMVH